METHGIILKICGVPPLNTTIPGNPNKPVYSTLLFNIAISFYPVSSFLKTNHQHAMA
jgi:hypothetical protein